MLRVWMAGQPLPHKLQKPCLSHLTFFLHPLHIPPSPPLPLPQVINADVMQMYAGLAVTTNQPSEVERRGVPHHLLGGHDPRGEPLTIIQARGEGREGGDGGEGEEEGGNMAWKGSFA